MESKICYIINSNGYRLFCTYWEPKETPKALVFISHGFAEHSQYYDTLACALTKIGCFVHAHDHVGHGRSEGQRVQIDDIDTYVSDIFQHTEIVRKKYPDLPFYYIGHSMGTAIGLMAAIKRPNYFKGMVLIGVLIELSNKGANLATSQLCHVISWMFPNLPIFPMDYSILTRDQAIKKARLNDPFSWHGFSRASWCSAILRAMEDIGNNMQVIDGQLLLLHGDDDRICSVKGTKLFYEKSSSTDKTLKIYPKCYHNLLEEPEGIKEQVLEDIIGWLKHRIN